jgi:hypothetical protein
VKSIDIRCKGSRYIRIDSLINFQGNLKELKKEEYYKLKTSLIKYGFRFPVLVWENEGQNYFLDGHQRIFVVKELLKEGYTIEDIPVVDVEAKDKQEAKKLLLFINSRYGKITDEGLYEYIETSGLDFAELKTELDLPEIDLNKFGASYYEDIEIKEKEIEKLEIENKCPKCGYEW